MAQPLHDKEDFGRLGATLADLMAAAAPAGEGAADAQLQQRLAELTTAGSEQYEEGHSALAVVLVELAAGQEGRLPDLQAVCAALQPMLQLGERLRHCCGSECTCWLPHGSCGKSVAGTGVALLLRYLWHEWEEVLQAIASFDGTGSASPYKCTHAAAGSKVTLLLPPAPQVLPSWSHWWPRSCSGSSSARLCAPPAWWPSPSWRAPGRSSSPAGRRCTGGRCGACWGSWRTGARQRGRAVYLLYAACRGMCCLLLNSVGDICGSCVTMLWRDMHCGPAAWQPPCTAVVCVEGSRLA
jgi:hypothetical protein